MHLNSSLLFVVGGELEFIEISGNLSLAELFTIYHLNQIVSSKCDICVCSNEKPYVIYRIDTYILDGVVYPRIYIFPSFELIGIRHLNINTLVLGNDFHNRISIRGLDEFPNVHEEIYISFSSGDEKQCLLNGSYLVTEIDVVAIGDNSYPRIQTKKVASSSQSMLRKFDFSNIQQPVGY